MLNHACIDVDSTSQWNQVKNEVSAKLSAIVYAVSWFVTMLEHMVVVHLSHSHNQYI